MEPALCPDLAAGDLVVTELRGKQPTPADGAPTDTGGQWIELYNASGATIDLRGLHVRPRLLDGSSQPVIIVRQSLPVEAGGYVVLGGSEAVDEPPATFDYNWYPDFSSADSSTDVDSAAEDRDLFDAAALDLEACEVRIDRIVYDDLPALGTYSLNGAPDADRNDMDAEWCNDLIDDADPSTVGLPGTPGSGNHPCS
jgi:hypothetical protein